MLVAERARLKTDRGWLAEVQKKLEEAKKKTRRFFRAIKIAAIVRRG